MSNSRKNVKKAAKAVQNVQEKTHESRVWLKDDCKDHANCQNHFDK